MDIHLLIGLGNPGRKYRKTRHNIGFVVLDELARLNGFEVEKKKFKSRFALVELFDRKICFVKPEAFMNLSGEAVGSFLNYYEVDPTNLLVVHDDIDLPLGGLRFSFSSGHGGHNGVRSILDHVDTKGFYRLRIGIGRPPPGIDPADYVLMPFENTELCVVGEIVKKAVSSIEVFYKDGSKAAMQIFNK